MGSITILYYLKHRENKKGERQIYMRLTVDGKRKETSLNRSISASRWDKSKQCAKGRSEDMLSLNKYLVNTKQKLYETHQKMIYDDQEITVETLMNKFLGIGESTKTLLEIITFEMSRIQKLVKDGTYRKYEAFYNHIGNFIKHQYNASDIDIKRVDFQFVNDFDFYLRTEEGIGNNTTIRYVKTLQKFFKIAKNNGWVNSTPFTNYKVSFDKVERTKLNNSELQRIINKHFKIDRLNRIRDLFVFACYSGLSFGDLEKLNENHIVTGMDGRKWLKINRSKTGTSCSIPLLPQAKEILKKYEDDINCLNKGVLLPVVSNERYNAYLKEIADLCGISKNLTTHVARHTFATTVTAEQGVSTEVVSRMLGHTQLKTTQIYSKITDTRISRDMNRLFDSTGDSKLKKSEGF